MLSSDLVRSVLDSAPDAIVVIDSSGVIVFANHQVAALFGYSNEEIVGSRIETLLPERFRGRHVEHRSSYTRKVRVRPMGMGLDLFGLRKDGSEFPVEISLSPISQGNELIVAAAIRDVTARMHAEQALKEARREADRANLAKSRFLATASHDLRQPLQTLSLLNGALRRMVRDGECLEVLSEQELAIDAMSRLLNALLDISKLESGAIKLDLADFEIGALFDDLRRDFAGLAASKGLRLSIDSPRDAAHSDPALVGQMLRNLLSNAIKYTPSGSVELRCDPRGQMVRIEVRDSGVGIAPEHLSFIFDEFYQIGVSPQSSRDGFGLGLSIVQRIARLLDVKVHVESEPGKGSVFSLELPAATAAKSVPTPSAGHHAGIRSGAGGAYRILLVEDDPGVRNAMLMLLKIEGYQVMPAATADEALQTLRLGGRIDLLITDFHLEGSNTGTQVIAAARAVFGKNFKSILVTGDTSSAVRDIQCDEQLRITSKPINSNELLTLVRNLLTA